MNDIKYSFDEDNVDISEDHELIEGYINEEFQKSSEDTPEDLESYEDEEEEISYEDFTEKRPKKTKFSLKKLLIGFAALSIVGVAFLASPFFQVTKIEMNELTYYTREDILSRINLYEGINGIFFNKSKAESILAEDNYIISASITFILPDTMLVSVNENIVYGYVSYLSNYLCLNKDGYVIDIVPEKTLAVPVIDGLKFSSFVINERPEIEDEAAFEAALMISRAVTKNEMNDRTITVNVADTNNIYAYINNIKILLGDTTRIDEKITTAIEAVNQLEENDRGTLDVSNLSKPIIFKYAT